MGSVHWSSGKREIFGHSMDALKQRSDRRSSLTKPLPYPTTKKPKGKESKGPFRKKGKGGDHQAAGQQPQHRSTVPSAPVPSSSSSQPVRGGEKIRKIMHAAANPLLKPPAGARPSQKMGELPSFLPLDSSSIIKPASPPSGNDDKMLLAAQSPSKDALKQREALKRKISSGKEKGFPIYCPVFRLLGRWVW